MLTNIFILNHIYIIKKRLLIYLLLDINILILIIIEDINHLIKIVYLMIIIILFKVIELLNKYNINQHLQLEKYQ